MIRFTAFCLFCCAFFTACTSEKEKVSIDMVSYSVEQQDDDSGEPIVYNMCKMMGNAEHTIIASIISKQDTILSDHCQGGDFSRKVTTYQIQVLSSVYGKDLPQNLLIYDLGGGAISDAMVGGEVLMSLRVNRDQYFVDIALKAYVNSNETNNVPDNVVIEIPNDYNMLVSSAQDTARNITSCEDVTVLSDDEYNSYVRGDSNSCQEQEPEPSQEDMCSGDDVPECCLNDLVDC